MWQVRMITTASSERRVRRRYRQPAEMIADVRFIDGVDERETGGRVAGLKTVIHQI